MHTGRRQVKLKAEVKAILHEMRDTQDCQQSSRR